MFTQSDYATLTRSQRRGHNTRTLAKRFAIACVPVTVIFVAGSLVEKAMDKKN